MSYLVEPQTNASVLAEILMQIDPAQHDAVVLMEQVLTNQVAGNKAIFDLQKHSLQDWRIDNDFTSLTATLAAQAIEQKVSIEQLTDAIISNSKLTIENGQYTYQLHEAVNAGAVTDIKQIKSIIEKDIK